ncbi:MAG TPA: mannitol dehydrogenase family protein [Geminicoccaceae bacterium]|nr:mannitol dehydrogenase family protein [Geminicoccus sp.]HMU51118.1 mannitol dehydrogenase family protein [Geminicoccaceae bacterium]
MKARLSPDTLAALPGDVAVPAYDRAAVTPGIVHLGVGGFHRAHQAAVVDDCLAAGETSWGIVAASLRSPETRDALQPQAGLYTLAIREDAGTALRVVGSIGEVLVGPEDPAALLARLADPRTRIVSLTVTEKGYLVDLASGTLKADDPGVIHDLAQPAAPRTALGYLAQGLWLRRQAGAAPFTVMSCDNLPSNGRTLRRVLTDFATARDPAFGRFVADEVAFPSTMVDRIVPKTTDADRKMVDERLGVADAWPVMTEPFLQWVVEDRFPAGRPALESAGAEMVADVEPFEHMKLRLLNGAHTSLAAIGRLAGHQTVAEAIADPQIRRLVEAYWSEAIPTLGGGAGDPAAYTRSLLARFSNGALPHRTQQIATDSSQKIPQRILAPLQERLAAGQPSPAMTFAVAAWIRSCGGLDDAGRPIPFGDPIFDAWKDQPDQRRAPTAETVRAFLGLGPVFGSELPRHEGFVRELTADYAAIADKGIAAALAGKAIAAASAAGH